MTEVKDGQVWARGMVVLLVVIIVVVIALVGWRLATEESSTSQRGKNRSAGPIPVLTEQLSIGPISQVITIGGSIDAEQHVMIRLRSVEH